MVTDAAGSIEAFPIPAANYCYRNDFQRHLFFSRDDSIKNCLKNGSNDRMFLQNRFLETGDDVPNLPSKLHF